MVATVIAAATVAKASNTAMVATAEQAQTVLMVLTVWMV
jgi:hypothetical protein